MHFAAFVHKSGGTLGSPTVRARDFNFSVVSKQVCIASPPNDVQLASGLARLVSHLRDPLSKGMSCKTLKCSYEFTDDQIFLVKFGNCVSPSIQAFQRPQSFTSHAALQIVFDGWLQASFLAGRM